MTDEEKIAWLKREVALRDRMLRRKQTDLDIARYLLRKYHRRYGEWEE